MIYWILLGFLGLFVLLESGLVKKVFPDVPRNPEEQEFLEYVAAELHKANEGAANAESWAVALIEEYRRRGSLG